MSAAEDRREELEALIRQRVGGAYRYGLVSAGIQGGAPLGYPQENRDTDAILAAAEACAEAGRRRAPHEPRPPKPPAVHYDPAGSGRPACVPGDTAHGRDWPLSPVRRLVTCGNCRRGRAWREAAGDDP